MHVVVALSRSVWAPLLGITIGVALGIGVIGTRSILPADTSDEMTVAELVARAAAFSSLSPFPLQVVAPSEIERALATMALTTPEELSLRARVLSGRQRLAWLAVWDDAVVDGDAVTIRSGDYQREVALTAAPVDLAIPLPADGVIDVIGTHDGDSAGITASIRSGTQTGALPVMREGDDVRVPVLLRVAMR